MLISMNWISEYTDLSGIDMKELINRFTLSTAEVEEVYEMGTQVQKVVVGEILEVMDHPKSKKLHLLKVNTGDEIVDCVCGAPNVAVGAYVPFAKLGGQVGGMKIEEVTLAGEVSRGMCCSEKELGISEEHSGLLLLDKTHAPGTDIKTFIPLDDIVFEVDNKSLTNRPDLWGHYGIARELSVLTKRPLKPLPAHDLRAYETLSEVPVTVLDTEHCYRYSCISVDHVTERRSPLAMRVRLTYCGMRPINLLTDLTNYLMLEMGQPMHAFDHALVKEITVKSFDAPFAFETLDGVERTITPETMMICNEAKAVAIAGVMGGEQSCITDETTSVLLESANFDGVSVRKSAARLGMRTDSSARYEKTLDPEMTVPAIARFLELLLAIDPAAQVSSRLTDCYVKRYETIQIAFDKAYVDKYTGIDISAAQIEETLRALAFAVERDGDAFTVTVPSFRATKDVTMKADIIEEITRVYGYDNFALRSNKSLLSPVQQSVSHEDEYRLKTLLSTRFGMNEVQGYLWYDTKLNRELGIETKPNVRIINSLAAENDVLRATMLPNLINTAAKNAAANAAFSIYEVGRVADGIGADGLCVERRRIGILMADKEQSEKALFFALKEAVDYAIYSLKAQLPRYVNAQAGENYCHPVNTADIWLEDKRLGLITCLHPQVRDRIDKKLTVVMAELDLDMLDACVRVQTDYREISRYPQISVDFSLLMDRRTPYAVLEAALQDFSCEYLQDVKLVDIYEDETLLAGKKSVTIRLEFGSMERTLESEEINAITERLLAQLKERGMELR